MAAAPPPHVTAHTGTSTVAYATSSRLVSATITAMPSSTRSPRRKSQPSRSRSRYRDGGSAASTGAPAGRAARRASGRVAQARIAADRPKLTASTTRALAGPITATRPPANAAPSSDAVRSTVACRPVARSIGTSACSTSAGTSACLALSPGPRRAPAQATMARKTPNGSRPAACSNGIAPTTTIEPRSHPMLIRRAPTRSMTGPPSTLSSTMGSSSASATRPVFTGEWVVTSTK